MEPPAMRQRPFLAPSTQHEVTAVLFDTFGTVVDWRRGIAQAVADFAARHRLGLAPEAFADAWRAEYDPSMARVRSGERPYVPLSQLHRENLERTLARHGLRLADFDAAEIATLNRAWERLPAWPDSVPGLAALKRQYVIGPLSNGDVALLVHLAKFAGLPWDLIIGSDLTHAYKPQPEAYLRAAAILRLPPGEVMLVAAHNADLQGAREAGLATGFVARSREHGPAQTTDLAAASDWDVVADDLVALAARLGAP